MRRFGPLERSRKPTPADWPCSGSTPLASGSRAIRASTASPRGWPRWSPATRCSRSAPARLSAATGAVPLLVVDRVGALATLYGAGTMAYVGGGFGRAGLHSVLEPAAWGVPVAFGPRWRDSRDAALLLEAGAATALSRYRVK